MALTKVQTIGIETGISLTGVTTVTTLNASTDTLSVGGTVNFGGNVSIAGTLTYEDVTNIDSVGIITARSGINVTGGDVGIGLTNPEDYGNFADDLVIYDSSQPGMTFASGTSGYGSIYFADGTTGNAASRGQIQYGHSDDYMAFATAATERLRIDSSGRLLLGITSSAGGTLQVNGGIRVAGSGSPSDATSPYIYRTSGADNLCISTDGTERMRIDSSGRLLLGTTTEGVGQSDDLTVATSGDTGITVRSGTSSNGNLFFSDGTSGTDEYRGYVQYDHSANELIFGSDATARMRIDSSGRIGMGNDSPGSYSAVADDLVVGNHSGAHGITIAAENNNTAYLRFADGTANSGQQANGQIAYSHADLSMRFNVDASERMRIDSSGRLLIGTSSSTGSHKLEVNGGTDNEPIKVESSDAGAYIRFEDNDTTGSTRLGAVDNDFKIDVGSSERMRIDSSGNVAIGPNTQGHGLLTLSKSASSAFNALVIQQGNTGSADSDGLHIGIDSAVDAYITHKENRALAFGTANTERMRIDSSGIVKINQATGNTFRVQNSTSGEANMLFQNSSTGTNAGNGLYIGIGSDEIAYVWHYHNESLVFAQNNTERARINTSGDFLVGTSSHSPGLGNQNSGFQVAAAGYIAVSRSGGQPCYFNRRTNTGTIVGLSYNGTQRGTISTDGTVVAFNTSSDHRLKENIVDLDGAITRVKQLQPRRFNFIESPSTTIDGFVAHEAQTVVPEAVTGTHNEVDDDNNPVYQGIDTSKLVPLLTAALQEAIAEIETLKTKVAALEG